MCLAIRDGQRVKAQFGLASLCAALCMGASPAAIAACSGSVAAPNSAGATILCNGPGTAGPATAGAPEVVTSATSKIDHTTTTTAGNNYYASGNNLYQFDGHGRTLQNSGDIINERVYTGISGGRTRIAVFMGSPTRNGDGTTTYSTPTYDPGSNTTSVAVNGTTVTSAYVGQSIVFGRYAAAENDFAPAGAFVITAVSGNTITIAGRLPANYSGPGSNPERYAIVSNYGGATVVNGVSYNNVIENSGTISATISTAEVYGAGNTTGVAPERVGPSNTAAVRAIQTAVSGDYLIRNSGTLFVSHGGIGTAATILEGGQVNNLRLENSGRIETNRLPLLTLTSVSATNNPMARIPEFSPQVIGNTWAVATEEEGATLTLLNAATGVIRAKGDYTVGIYSRVVDASITNHGLIEHLSGSGVAGDYSKGFAIGHVSYAGGIRTIDVDNDGTIHGDFLAVNGLAVRWYLLSTEGVVTTTGNVTTVDRAAGVDQRLLINSQTGQADSQFENRATGTTIGNFWYSNGAHILSNGGTIVGNIDVDQRDTTYSNGSDVGPTPTALARGDDSIDPATGQPRASNNTAIGTNYTIRGDKMFTFTNQGAFTGDIFIRNASSTIAGAAYGSQTINKTVSSENTIQNAGTFDGNIVINDVAGARNTINLSGDGFGRRADGSINPASGNITAVNGSAENILNLDGDGTLRGNVTKFTTLNLGTPASSGGNAAHWTINGGNFLDVRAANIINGTLNVLGNITAATTTVGSGGTLAGSGNVVDVVTQRGGTLAPGSVAAQAALKTGTPNVTGTRLNVWGDLALLPGARLAIFATPTQSTSVAATGNASIDGARLRVLASSGRYSLMRDDTIVTAAGGVTGRFASISDNLAFLKPMLTYAPTSIVLSFAPDAGALRAAAVTSNQRNVAGVLANAARNNPNNPVVSAIFNLQNGAQARAAFDSLSGEGITAAQNTAQRSAALFTSSIFDQTTFFGPGGSGNSITLGAPPIRELADLPSPAVEPVVPLAPQRTWRAWGAGFGGVEDIHGNGALGTAAQQSTLYGGTIGVDYQLTANYLFGVALGGTDGEFKVPGRTTSGSTTGGHIAIYDLATFGRFYGASTTSFSYFSNRTTRTTGGFGTLASETERGSFDSHEFRTRLEFGRHFDGFGFASSITPFVALEIADLRSNGFGETSVSGPGLLRLNVQGQSAASVPAFVGARFQHATNFGGLALTPTLQVAWVHEFAPYRSQIAGIADLPGATFLVDGARPARDAAQVKAGGELALGPNSALFASFDGEFSGISTLYAGKGGVRWAW